MTIPMTIRHHLKKHRTKIAITLPIAFLLASSLTLVRDHEEIYLTSEDSRYVEVGEQVTIQVLAKADEPINVIGANIHVPSDMATINAISREDSIIDLWTQEPSATDGTIAFSGGIITDNGYTGDGTLFSFVVTPTTEGTIEITFEDPQMLAHDGTGVNVEFEDNSLTLTVRPQEHPSPDVNGDKTVNLYDFGIVSVRIFMAYERSYDLNMDGKINLTDIGILFANMRNDPDLGSLAVGWI